MPAYSINLCANAEIADTMIVEMADLLQVRIELARFVGEMLRDHADLIWEDQDWRIDVSDGDGLILYALHVSASDTPATRGSGRRV